MALLIKYNVDLKEWEKYGFEEHYNTYTRDYNNGYLTMVDKETGEILKVDYERYFNRNKYYKNSTYEIDDLIKADLVVKVEE